MLLDKLNLLKIFGKSHYFNKHDLPDFPDFKSVEFSDKPAFDKLIQNFDTYSDFNFNSFFSWDTEHRHELSHLNGNLVLKFADYITGEAFYALIGINDIDNTLNTLLNLSEKQGLEPKLKLIPEVTIQAIKNTQAFIIEEDPDNFDYVFSISELSELVGKRFKNKRQAAKKCTEGKDIKINNQANNLAVTQDILKVSKKWEVSKKQEGKAVDMEYEIVAIERILQNFSQQESLHIAFAERNGELVGFSIDELLPNKFVLSHYFKTLPHVKGLAEYLNMHIAKELKALGYEYWNWEQDLGINSLKRMKLSHRPKFHQKKFIVKRQKSKLSPVYKNKL